MKTVVRIFGVMKMTNNTAMKTIAILDKAFKNSGFTYKVIKKSKNACVFCDYPSWLLEVKHKHEWSDDVVEYDVIRISLHNFIEVDDIISIKPGKRSGLSLGLFRLLDKLQTKLIQEFNAHNSSLR